MSPSVLRRFWRGTWPRAPPCSTSERTAGGVSGLWWARSLWPQRCGRDWSSPSAASISLWSSRWRPSPSSTWGRSLSIPRATSSSCGFSQRPQCETSTRDSVTRTQPLVFSLLWPFVCLFFTLHELLWSRDCLSDSGLTNSYAFVNITCVTVKYTFTHQCCTIRMIYQQSQVA